jgi:outer membrane lipoprotein-sorting protein
VVNVLRLGIVVALALFGASSCERVPVEGAKDQPSASQSESSKLQWSSAQTTLIERIQQAPLRVKHGGTRRLEFHYASEGVEHTLAYQEHVTADGQGRFALDPGQIEQPAMNTQQREVFELLQKQHEGFFFRYRDFGVRQRNLFEANYSVQVLGTPIAVAGRTCTQIDVRRNGRNASSTYRAAIDDETGLVMRWTESTLDGRLLARSEFVDFTLDPVLDGVEWFVSPLQVESLQSGQDLSAQDLATLGFQPHSLQVLPPGYQLLRSERVIENETTWLRRVYGDGLENLFVLERGPDLETPHTAPSSDHPNRDAQHASSTAQSGTGQAGTNSGGQITVRICQAGQWTLAEVSSGPGQLFVIGKVGEADVVDCLQSAF